MGLDDLARFLAPKRPERAKSILRCFYDNDEGCTLADMMAATGLREKALRYYITKFKWWKLLWSERRYCQQAIYRLEPKAFHVRLDTVLIDPLHCLASPQPWQSGSMGKTKRAEYGEA